MAYNFCSTKGMGLKLSKNVCYKILVIVGKFHCNCFFQKKNVIEKKPTGGIYFLFLEFVLVELIFWESKRLDGTGRKINFSGQILPRNYRKFNFRYAVQGSPNFLQGVIIYA